MDTLIFVSRPSTSHLAVIVAALEHRFHNATTRRCLDNGPAHTCLVKSHPLSKNIIGVHRKAVNKKYLNITFYLDDIIKSFYKKDVYSQYIRS